MLISHLKLFTKHLKNCPVNLPLLKNPSHSVSIPLARKPKSEDVLSKNVDFHNTSLPFHSRKVMRRLYTSAPVTTT